MSDYVAKVIVIKRVCLYFVLFDLFYLGFFSHASGTRAGVLVCEKNSDQSKLPFKDNNVLSYLNPCTASSAKLTFAC